MPAWEHFGITSKAAEISIFFVSRKMWSKPRKCRLLFPLKVGENNLWQILCLTKSNGLMKPQGLVSNSHCCCQLIQFKELKLCNREQRFLLGCRPCSFAFLVVAEERHVVG